MAKVRVRTREPESFQAIRSLVPADETGKYSDTELDSKIRFIEPGSDHSLQLFEIDYLPGAAIDIHAHLEDEIIYVVDGAMKLGNRMIGPGSSVFVTGNTLYSFTAGPEGLRMLNFRARADMSFITREEFRNR